MTNAGQARRLKQDLNFLAKKNKELTEQLRQLQDNSAESEASIQRLKDVVASINAPEASDVETQCNLRGRGLQSQFVAGGKAAKDGSPSSKPAPPPAEFKFLPRDRRINWKLLQRVNVERVMRTNDTATVCQLMDEVMYGDLDGESVFNLTEGNLIRAFKLAQLMLEFVNHERLVLEYQYEEFLENRELVLQLLERAGVGTLDDIRDGTEHLGRKFQGLAGPELEGMFSQVRVEERAMSRMALAGVIEETKRRYEAEVEEETRLGQELGSGYGDSGDDDDEPSARGGDGDY